jgi:autotransporter-associated beta strand protein
MLRGELRALAAAMCLFACATANAVTTVFFNSSQVATPVASGVTSDTISSEGYLFTYTRDKLFTGGGSQPIGRAVRVPWPQGVEAQAVTTPPPGVTDYKARIDLQRLDGDVFDIPAFTAKLLANTAATGASIEIMPSLNGEDAFNDPLYFDASGYYGNTFSYTTAPSYLGSTALLTGYDRYKITLFVDFALTALQLNRNPADLVWTGTTNGVWDAGATANFSGKPSGKFGDGDSVTFDDSGQNTAITIAAGGVAPGSVVFFNTTKNYSLSGAAIRGAADVGVFGGGHVSLGGANTYTGGTIVSTGVLTLTGSAATGSVLVGVDGTLELSTPGGAAAILPDTPITNDGILRVLTAGQEAGIIDGAGRTTVAGSLTADSIVQDTLTIGAGGSVTIRETVVAGGANQVPEPSTIVLLLAGTAGLVVCLRRGRRTS